MQDRAKYFDWFEGLTVYLLDVYDVFLSKLFSTRGKDMGDFSKATDAYNNWADKNDDSQVAWVMTPEFFGPELYSDLRRIMDDQQILLVNLSKGEVGEDASQYVTRLFPDHQPATGGDGPS